MINRLAFVIVAGLFFSGCGPAGGSAGESASATEVVGEPARSSAQALRGEWRVGLQRSSDSQLDWRMMVFSDVFASSGGENGAVFKLLGTYGESSFTEGYANDAWGRAFFGFVTEEEAGFSVVTGVLDGDLIEGTTHAVDDRSLTVWTAARTEDGDPVIRRDPHPAPAIDSLSGLWEVDLRPEPGADPYFIPLELEVSDPDGLAGTFYWSEIENLQVNTDRGEVHLAFVTRDPGGGRYFSSAVLRGGRLEGRTLALERNFVSPWIAIRASDRQAGGGDSG